MKNANQLNRNKGLTRIIAEMSLYRATLKLKLSLKCTHFQLLDFLGPQPINKLKFNTVSFYRVKPTKTS